MGQFDVTGPDKKTYRVTVPEGATQDQAIDYVKKKYYGGATDQPPGPIEKSPPGDDTMGFFERIGVGAEDAFQGAAQWLEHVTPGATYLDSFNNWLVDQGWPGKVLGLGKVDIDP